jgi:hypothetical protein
MKIVIASVLPAMSFACIGFAYAQPTGTQGGITSGSVTTIPVLVSQLPQCGFQVGKGARAYVTDLVTATTWGGAVTGGGTTSMAVVCNGSSWLQD